SAAWTTPSATATSSAPARRWRPTRTPRRRELFRAAGRSGRQPERLAEDRLLFGHVDRCAARGRAGGGGAAGVVDAVDAVAVVELLQEEVEAGADERPAAHVGGLLLEPHHLGVPEPLQFGLGRLRRE